MFVKIVFDGSLSIVELAKFCGVAPCQILAANMSKVQSGGTHGCTEQELVGRAIDLPVSTPAMIRVLPWIYTVGEDGKLVRKNKSVAK